jgi:2-polyprenyl-3-methyl-5-hydroxy-6-metoxy-1,4-benzoquinol methylase
MKDREKKNVFKVYDIVGDWFYENRSQSLMEKDHLDSLISKLPVNARILDLGCGAGKPIYEYLVHKKFKVVGVDASEKMISIAKKNFPSGEFYIQDMRELALNQKFDAIIAWHSFFHIQQTDQIEMFIKFKEFLFPNGLLLLTTGTEKTEVWSEINGKQLYHSSLSIEDYNELLKKNNFELINHTVNDVHCGGATVWLAKYLP